MVSAMRRLTAICAVAGAVFALGCKPKGTEAPAIPGGLSISPVSYGANSNASKDAINECHFELELPKALEKEIPGAKSGGGSSNTLTMEIVRISGATPDWQGEHAVIVEGEYNPAEGESKKFRIKRSEFGGAFGGMSGVCKGLDKVAEQMAIDIATWLEKPEDNNRL
jgi:hypothetical protein